MALTKITQGVTKPNEDYVAGIVTATKFVGDGSELTGVAGLGVPLTNDQTNPLSNIFKTAQQLTIANGQTVTVESDEASGNVAYTPYGRVIVENGGVLRIVSGTAFRINVLGVF